MKNTFYVVLCFNFLIFTSCSAQQKEKKMVPYSNHLKTSDLIFLSGQIGKESSADNKIFKDEVEATLQNITHVLKDAGSSLDKVISVNVYLKDMDTFSEFNEVYLNYFNAPYPTRTCIGVNDLVLNANIEITIVAKN